MNYSPVDVCQEIQSSLKKGIHGKLLSLLVSQVYSGWKQNIQRYNTCTSLECHNSNPICYSLPKTELVVEIHFQNTDKLGWSKLCSLYFAIIKTETSYTHALHSFFFSHLIWISLTFLENEAGSWPLFSQNKERGLSLPPFTKSHHPHGKTEFLILISDCPEESIN